MSGKTNSVIVWYKMLWTTIFLFPIFYLIKDLMKLFCYVGEIQPIFTSIILCGCSTCLILVTRILLLRRHFEYEGPPSLPCNFRFFPEWAYFAVFCMLLWILRIYLNFTDLRLRKISQALSCVIYTLQTGD